VLIGVVFPGNRDDPQMAATAPTLDELTVADAPAAWRDCGFEVVGDTCLVGETRIHLAGSEAGSVLAVPPRFSTSP